MIRLDKLLSGSLPCTRKDAAGLIRSGRVAVDGTVIRKPDTKLEENAELTVDGAPINARRFIYIMMNKPAGLISATDDVREKTVLSLLPDEYLTKNIFPAGRLDKDTTGLLILTNDGALAHKLLSPKNRCEKSYLAECDIPFDADDPERVKDGVMLDDGKTCPVKMELVEGEPNKAVITVTEGRFHEVKRICIAIGKHVTSLERIRFCGLDLDRTLSRGEWRDLTDEEVDALSTQS